MPKSPLRITALGAALAGAFGVGSANPAASGAGITFPATQSASSDVNTLDDYEEGTFTPTITFTTPGDLAVTYAVRLGRYTKIGRKVFYQINVQTSAFTYTTASGQVAVSGLPFSPVVASSNGIGGILQRGISAATAQQFVSSAGAGVGTPSVFIYAGKNDGAQFLSIGATHIPTGTTLDWYISGSYEV